MYNRAKRLEKPSEKILQEKERKFKRLNIKISEIEKIAEGAGCEFWKCYKKIIKEKLDSTEIKLDSFETLTDKEISVMLTRRQSLKMFLSFPEDAEKDMEMMRKELEKERIEIGEYRKRLSAS